MFTFDSKVRYSEISKKGTLSIKALVDYFQDCSTLQSESLGAGLKFLKMKERAWLLSSWQIVVNFLPDFNDDITIGTDAYKFDGLFGYRNFAMYDRSKNNSMAACANSYWFLYDTANKMPAKITDEFGSIYPAGIPLKMNYAPRKISKIDLSAARELEPFTVNAAMIDTNSHMNNEQYINMASTYVPDNFKIHQIRADYKKSALEHDVIVPFIIHEKTGSAVNCPEYQDLIRVAMCGSESSHAPYAYVDFYM